MMEALLGRVAGNSKTYIEDVALVNVRTGTGGTLTVTGGPDMSTKGGLCITKSRSAATGWRFVDSARGTTKSLDSSSTAAEATESTGLTAFTASGATFGADTDYNNSGATYLDIFLAKAAKFFDVVTFTTSASTNTNQRISHSLGQAPGMIILKATGAVSSWPVWHRRLTDQTSYYLILNGTAAEANYGNCFGTSAPSATDFGINTNFFGTNQAMVAYVLAHDTSADGLIQCGSFTTDGSGNATVTLGWEPQFFIEKTSSAIGGWTMVDQMRGWAADGSVQYVQANGPSAEAAGGGIKLNATGFTVSGFGASVTRVYLAIRRGPMRAPTSGTQVYQAIARTGTGAAATVTGVGFPPDLVIAKSRLRGLKYGWFDRLRGAPNLLDTTSTGAEITSDTTSLTGFDVMDGVRVGSDTAANETINSNGAPNGYITYFLRRYPGVFSTLCYNGTGSNKTETHNLGAAPELWLVKGRSGATQWVWGSSLLAATEKIVMPSPAGKATDATAWNSTYPTSTTLSLGTAAAVNTSSATYTAYLWATLPGISKVFGYTGDGSSGKQIECGFSAGARFVMIVRTDTAGSVYVWDSVRGIVSGNDGHLSLDTTAAEVTTDDSVDPYSGGFIVNQVAATNINVNGGTYIGLAIA